MWAKYGANIGQSLVQIMGKIWTKIEFLIKCKMILKYERNDTQVKVTKKRAVDFQAEQDVRNALRSEIIGGVRHAVSNV